MKKENLSIVELENRFEMQIITLSDGTIIDSSSLTASDVDEFSTDVNSTCDSTCGID